MLAAEELGLAQFCPEMTMAYLKERRQFGRPIGPVQALKHPARGPADNDQQPWAASRYAAVCLADGGPESVQLHGGIGSTWEHPRSPVPQAGEGVAAVRQPVRAPPALAGR